MGSTGRQSLLTLGTLLELGIRPLAVALARDRPGTVTPILAGIKLTAATPTSELEILAQQHRVPIVDGSAQAALAELAPDLILVSCYPHRLTNELIALPRSGCYNLHPSRLPDYRGPSPIFWQLRNGQDRLGVSVHRITDQLDRGPLLCREQPPPLVNASYNEWVDHLTAAGVRGFVRLLDGLKQGKAALTQQPAGGSYFSWPQPEDFEIDPAWRKTHIIRFISGTAELGRHFVRLDRGRRFLIESPRTGSALAGEDNGGKAASARLMLDCADGSLELSGSYLAASKGANR